MSQRNVVVTGANTGIGKETAVALASVGDRVTIACRNPEKASAAVDEIKERSFSDAVDSVPLDLADLSSIRRCAAELHERLDHVDVLINNAGLIMTQRVLTADGFETTFGVNHVGTFLLTNELADLVRAAPSPRVINLASAAHWGAVRGLNFEDLMSTRFYNGWVAYFRAKLANIYFTQELARRWRADNVVVHAVHPGSVNSRFGRDGDTTGISAALMSLSHLVTIPPAQGADTSVWLACSEEGGDLSRSGNYWLRRRLGRLAPWAKRDVDAKRLWTVTEQLIAGAS